MQDEEVFNEVAAGEKHAPWVGILASFLTVGAGQFLAGFRKRGVLWFIGLSMLLVSAKMVAASPLFEGIIPGLIILIADFVLWLYMLRDAYRPLPKLGLWKWLMVVIACLALNTVESEFAQAFISRFYMPSHSMEPTIRGNSPSDAAEKHFGDRLIVQKFAYWFSKPRRGDIAAFDTKGLPGSLGECVLMKRVVGLPGERISIKSGKLFVNGTQVLEPRVFAKITYVYPPPEKTAAGPNYLKDDKDEFVVPAAHCFVIGDNSAHSNDSRYFGPVPEANIVGKVTKIYWPLERIGIPE